jgi:hypothetical protein
MKAAERRPSRSGSKSHDAGMTKSIPLEQFAPARGVRLDPAQQAVAQRAPTNDATYNYRVIATRRTAVPFAPAPTSTRLTTDKRGQRRRYSAGKRRV